jgi:hypothetical protein
MRRLGVTLALGALLGMAGAAVTTAPALARGPQWQLVDVAPFTVPASSCGFEVGVAFPDNQSYVKALQASDGSTTFLETGQFDVSYTNLQTGQTITEKESGPGKTTVYPDGSITLTDEGHTGIFLTPADAQQFGLPVLSVTAGRIQQSIAADGTITSLTLQGHVLVNVCAALSGGTSDTQALQSRGPSAEA